MIKFEVLHVCKQSGARLGKITFEDGTEVETPCFMPVGTKASVKSLSIDEIEEVSDGLILANTYHLWLQPGTEVLDKIGGAKKFQGWKKALLTDSGGYQVFSLIALRKIEEEGVYFTNPENGDKLFLSPEISMDIQQSIGADIIMSFDECPPVYADFDYMKKSCERTIRWAKRGKEHLKSNQALFGICQGGLNKELRKYTIDELTKLDFPGYSIGGLAVGEKASEMYEVLDYVKDLLPFEKPRYLMGVGKPTNLLEGVIRGVDMFDCVLPTRNARHGQLLTSIGTLNIRNKKYEQDFTSIDPNSNHKFTYISKSYLRHLFKAKELLAQRIASVQNLAYLKKHMADIRKAIKEDRLLDFKEEFYKNTNYKD